MNFREKKTGIVLLLAVATACSDSEAARRQAAETALDPYEVPRNPPSTEIRDSAGVQLVHNRGRGLLGGELLPVREVLRIGAVEGDTTEEFAYISSIAIDRHGALYVGQWQGGSILAFDGNTGRYLRRFGRKGSGPGEFTAIRDL